MLLDPVVEIDINEDKKMKSRLHARLRNNASPKFYETVIQIYRRMYWYILPRYSHILRMYWRARGVYRSGRCRTDKWGYQEFAAPPVVSPPHDYVEKIEGASGYVVTHYDSAPLIERPEFTTVYCGSAAAGGPTGSLSDILRNGTRLINRRWSELSAMYRVWQDGPQSDVVGFSHYRRYLSFSPNHTETLITFTGDNLREVRDACYDEQLVKRVSRTYCIVPKPYWFSVSVPDQYALYCPRSDYEIAKKVAVERYPHLAAEFDQQLERKDLYACNLFYLCWADFDDLCRFWFSVLGEFCSHINWPRADPYQDRDVAFLAERLFDVWIRAKQKAGLHLDERATLFVG